MNKHLIATGALLVATTSVAWTAGGATASNDGQHAQGPAARVSARLAPTVVACDGGASLGLKTRIVNTPTTYAETATNAQDQVLPGAAVTLTGPSSGTDTVLVTVSGETQVTGGDASDWMGIEVKRNGTNINPYTASGDVMAFTGEPSWNLNSGQFCVKIGPGRHRFQVYVNLFDSGANSSLHGWVDDYTMSVQRFR